MDVFDEVFLKFWNALNSNGVRYIMVGGFANIIHGNNRLTHDMDMWIEDTLHNRNNLIKAFKQSNIGDYPMLATIQIIPGWTDFRLPNGMRLDLLIEMKGIEDYTFDECLELATKAKINELIVPFLHINHLIANKKAINRPKDKIDIAALEQIKMLRNNNL